MAAQDRSGFSNMTPAQKAQAFEDSHADPHGYAAANFHDPDQSTQLRVVEPQKPPQGAELPQRGRHKK
jgi:hypothetical protein